MEFFSAAVISIGYEMDVPRNTTLDLKVAMT